MHSMFLLDVSPLVGHLTDNGLFRVAVPTFFIINGFFYYQSLACGCSQQWITKVIYMYIIWMTVYSPFWIASLCSIENANSLIGVKIFTTLIFGYHHLWYISAIIFIAISFEIIQRIRDFNIALIVILMFFVGVFAQYAGNFNLHNGIYLDLILRISWKLRNLLFLGFPFFFLGVLISKKELVSNMDFKKVVIFTILSLILLIAESYTNYNTALRPGEYQNYASLILICPSIFILFIKINIIGNSKSIALYSSAIYLIHPAIQKLVEMLLSVSGTALTFLVLFLSVIASYMLIALRQKIKLIL